MNIQIIKPKKTKTYFVPTKIFFGRNSLMEINNLVSLQNINKLLIVCGNHFKESSNYNYLLNNIKKIKIDIYRETIRVSDFLTINKLTEYCRSHNIQAIMGIGGGSVLDTVKCASILVTNSGKVEDYVLFKTKKINKVGILCIEIPTTAGTGSEVTPWATVWGSNKKKYSLSSVDNMFPSLAIVDPQLTDNLPPKETATSGIDALCQAIESYWNIYHNPISDKYALEAIKIIIKSLEKAVNNPNKRIRNKMAWGSLLGGLAFSNTQTTICHAISYPITAHWNISHGQATAITLPIFIKYLLPVIPKHRKAKLLSAIGVATIPDAAIRIHNLLTCIGLKTKLSELGISNKGISIIIEEGFHPERIKNTPKIPEKSTLQLLLQNIW